MSGCGNDMQCSVMSEDESVTIAEHFARRWNRKLKMRSEHFLYLQISFAVEWKFGIQHGWGEVKVVVYPLRTKDVIEMCVGKKEEYRL